MVGMNIRVSRFRMAMAFFATLLVATSAWPQTAPPAAAASGQAKAVGEVKSMANGSLMLATDDGKNLNVSLPDSVHFSTLSCFVVDAAGAANDRARSGPSKLIPLCDGSGAPARRT